MKLRYITSESVIFFLFGAFMCLLGRPAFGLRVLNFIYPSSLWGERMDIIALLFVAYGIISFGLALLGLISVSKGLTLSARLAQGIKLLLVDLHSEIAATREFFFSIGPGLVWPFTALAIGAGIRGYYLSQPMRGDEAYTFLNFVNKDILSLFDYPVPNNHVLHTLLVKLSVLSLGASPASIRFPAFLAGVITIPLIYSLARELNPARHAGVLAAIITATFPYLVLYSTNARGYSIIIVLTLAAAFIGLRMVKNPGTGKVILLAFIAALGMFTMPSMLVGVAGVFCWLVALLLLHRQSLKKIFFEFTLPFGVLSGIFTFVLYTPVLVVANGIKPIIANKYVESQNWPEFFSALLPQTFKTLAELSRNIPATAWVLGLVLILAGLIHAIRSSNWEIGLLLPGLFIGAMSVVFFQHTVLYARTWIFMLPFIFLVTDFGFCTILAHLRSQFQTLIKTILVAGGIVFAGHLMSADIISKYPDTSAFPEAQLAVEYLKPILRPVDAVHVTNTADWPVYFYFWYYGMPQPPAQTLPDVGRTFIIVKKSRYSVNDLTNKPVIKLLDFDDLALYQEVRP